MDIDKKHAKILLTANIDKQNPIVFLPGDIDKKPSPDTFFLPADIDNEDAKILLPANINGQNPIILLSGHINNENSPVKFFCDYLALPVARSPEGERDKKKHGKYNEKNSFHNRRLNLNHRTFN